GVGVRRQGLSGGGVPPFARGLAPHPPRHLVGRPTRGREVIRRLVPRTRSSHYNCGESDCELRVQSGTRIIELLVSFDSEVRYGTCCKTGRTSESGHSPCRA